MIDSLAGFLRGHPHRLAARACRERRQDHRALGRHGRVGRGGPQRQALLRRTARSRSCGSPEAKIKGVVLNRTAGRSAATTTTVPRCSTEKAPSGNVPRNAFGEHRPRRVLTLGGPATGRSRNRGAGGDPGGRGRLPLLSRPARGGRSPGRRRAAHPRPRVSLRDTAPAPGRSPVGGDARVSLRDRLGGKAPRAAAPRQLPGQCPARPTSRCICPRRASPSGCSLFWSASRWSFRPTHPPAPGSSFATSLFAGFFFLIIQLLTTVARLLTARCACSPLGHAGGDMGALAVSRAATSTANRGADQSTRSTSATCFAALLPLAVYLMLEDRAMALVWLACFPVIVAATLATLSRGALVGLGALLSGRSRPGASSSVACSRPR